MQAHPDAQQFFIKHCLVERRLLARGVDEETARQKANEAEIKARKKAGDLKKIRTDGHLANYVLLHELHERNIMDQGMDYDHAHDESSKLELHHRHHPEELHAALAKEGWE